MSVMTWALAAAPIKKKKPKQNAKCLIMKQLLLWVAIPGDEFVLGTIGIRLEGNVYANEARNHA
jgi:hypothetical protein